MTHGDLQREQFPATTADSGETSAAANSERSTDVTGRSIGVVIDVNDALLTRASGQYGHEYTDRDDSPAAHGEYRVMAACAILAAQPPPGVCCVCQRCFS